MNSTLLIVPPEVDAVQVTGPLSVEPLATFEVTVSGETERVAFEIVTVLEAVAFWPRVEYAFTDSVWPPFARVVVSSVLPSPLK